MHFLISLHIYVFFLSSFINVDNSRQQFNNIDKIFINWNKATFSSITKQIKNSTNVIVKKKYQNRFASFKAFIEIDNQRQINKKSIRYKFLDKVQANKISGEFYVVEANRSGESYEIRNFIICVNTENSMDVVTYNYRNNIWVKDIVVKKMIGLNSNLENNISKFGTGFNQDDVIVTHFINTNIKDLQYYLFGTLSESSGFKKLLGY